MSEMAIKGCEGSRETRDRMLQTCDDHGDALGDKVAIKAETVEILHRDPLHCRGHKEICTETGENRREEVVVVVGRESRNRERGLGESRTRPRALKDMSVSISTRPGNDILAGHDHDHTTTQQEGDER